MIAETAIEFASEGAVLRGRLVMPSPDVARRPAVIMAHGTSATVEMVMIEYARVFARAGLVALVYDHRNLGRSGGEPPARSTRGCSAAATSLPSTLRASAPRSTPAASPCGETATPAARWSP